jgi:hypothetical protein
MTVVVVPGDLLSRAQTIAGLRELADYLQAHPGVPVRDLGWDLNIYPQLPTEALKRAEIDRIAAVLGVPVCDETGQRGHYTVTRSFGLVSYSAICVPDRRAAEHRALMSYSGTVAPDVAS